MAFKEYYPKAHWDFESPLEYEMYKARMDLEGRQAVFKPRTERDMFFDEIRSLEKRLSKETQKNLEVSATITTLNERIKYLEEAILELEGDKNA